MHSLSAFPPVFFRQLRFWSIHGTVNALPSLLVALWFLKAAKNPALVVLMPAAIACFILACAVITSLPGPLADDRHVLSRSLKKAVQIRSWIALLSLLLLAGAPDTLPMVPDVWCGMAAGWLVFLLSGRSDFMENGHWQTVLAVVMAEGVILAFLILLIGFFVLIVYQGRDRRKAFDGIVAPGTSLR